MDHIVQGRSNLSLDGYLVLSKLCLGVSSREIFRGDKEHLKGWASAVELERVTTLPAVV